VLARDGLDEGGDSLEGEAEPDEADGAEVDYFKRSRQYPGLRLEHAKANTVGWPSIAAIKIAYRLNRSSRYRRTGLPAAVVATMVPAPGSSRAVPSLASYSA
jgi:hypothetical protein